MSDLLKDSIINIINNHNDFFLNKSNVNGIGLGNKVINGIATNEPCLGIFVDNKITEQNLHKNQLIPKKFLGVKTDVIKSSSSKLLNSSLDPTLSGFRAKIIRPLQAGSSIMRFADGAWGTLGAIVFDNNDNTPYILSNNHVLSAFNQSSIGTRISQPGNPFTPTMEDISNQAKNSVAYLYKKVISKFNANFFNVVDCAIAKIFPKVPYTTEIYKIGKIKGIAEPQINMEVQKMGATTEYTTGTILYTNAINKLANGMGGYIWFKDLIVCSLNANLGDSGSLVLDLKNNSVGLLVGANSDKMLCFLNPITLVLKFLDIHF